MRTLRQLAILFAFGLAGELVSYISPVQTPASVIAPLLMLVAFLFKWIKPEHVEEVTQFFYAHMALLFIAPAVGVMRNLDLVRHALLPLVLICVLATIVTFLTAFLSVSFVRILTGRKGGPQ